MSVDEILLPDEILVQICDGKPGFIKEASGGTIIEVRLKNMDTKIIKVDKAGVVRMEAIDLGRDLWVSPSFSKGEIESWGTFQFIWRPKLFNPFRTVREWKILAQVQVRS